VFTTRFQAWVRRNALRLARLLARSPLTPNQITTVGMALTFVAAALAGFGRLLPAGIVLAFAGTFDILDGALARASKRSYPYGAFLDSTIDRYSEGAVYLGIAAFFLSQPGPWMRVEVLACMAALGGSFLVSYVRARAQSLGFTCDSGLFARPERVVLTVAGLVAAGLGFVPVLSIVVGLLAVATNFTALQRIYEVWTQARAQRRAREAAAKAPARGETSRP
jgi:CDP-diacylglycerol--glycerol-3-phosphate 3-phosphatidyltransferase